MNIAHLYFLGLNPEDSLPDKSLLSKFRTQRLEETTLDEIITEIVRQCVQKGIIESTSISIDTTHIEANTIKKTPERLMKHLARKIIKTYEDETKESLEGLPVVPEYKEIEDHKEAKKILEDPKFINQKGTRSLIDEDARVGRKSKHQSFYGYKTEFAMTTDERIITSVRTASGDYMDGSFLKEMLDQTKDTGIQVRELYGDKAYFRKNILVEVEKVNAKAYIPISASAYKIDETEYTYNKDSDQWECSQGNTTVKKKYFKRNNKSGVREGYKYYFEIKQCRECPKHDECAKKNARRILQVGLNASEYYEISQYQKTEEFKEKYKKRASIEGKNAELKRFHGLSRARGYGLVGVSKQSKIAAIAVNIKRIAAILSSKYPKIQLEFSIICIKSQIA